MATFTAFLALLTIFHTLNANYLFVTQCMQISKAFLTFQNIIFCILFYRCCDPYEKTLKLEECERPRCCLRTGTWQCPINRRRTQIGFVPVKTYPCNFYPNQIWAYVHSDRKEIFFCFFLKIQMLWHKWKTKYNWCRWCTIIFTSLLSKYRWMGTFYIRKYIET